MHFSRCFLAILAGLAVATVTSLPLVGSSYAVHDLYARAPLEVQIKYGIPEDRRSALVQRVQDYHKSLPRTDPAKHATHAEIVEDYHDKDEMGKLPRHMTVEFYTGFRHPMGGELRKHIYAKHHISENWDTGRLTDEQLQRMIASGSHRATSPADPSSANPSSSNPSSANPREKPRRKKSGGGIQKKRAPRGGRGGGRGVVQ